MVCPIVGRGEATGQFGCDRGVVRGRNGQVRASLSAAARAQLPPAGDARIGGRNYLVRSFRELGWGGEPLTVWVLVPS
jgi:hypothetical protein